MPTGDRPAPRPPGPLGLARPRHRQPLPMRHPLGSQEERSHASDGPPKSRMKACDREDTSPSQVTAARTLLGVRCPPGSVLSPGCRPSAWQPWEVGTGTLIPILQMGTCRAGREGPGCRHAAPGTGRGRFLRAVARPGWECVCTRVCVHRRCVSCICLHSSYLYPLVGCANSVVLNYARCNLDGDAMQVVLAISPWHL